MSNEELFFFFFFHSSLSLSKRGIHFLSLPLRPTDRPTYRLPVPSSFLAFCTKREGFIDRLIDSYSYRYCKETQQYLVGERTERTFFNLPSLVSGGWIFQGNERLDFFMLYAMPFITYAAESPPFFFLSPFFPQKTKAR